MKFNKIKDIGTKERLIYRINDFDLNIRDSVLYLILASLESALNIVD
jgi:hypothetical protein